LQITGPYLEDRTVLEIARRLDVLLGGFVAPPDPAIAQVPQEA
jgi:hypothetical protein